MSDSALASALHLMQEAVGRDVPVVFHLSDMLGYLQSVRGSYDVIIAAFALHHLTPEDKKEACFLETARKRFSGSTPQEVFGKGRVPGTARFPMCCPWKCQDRWCGAGKKSALRRWGTKNAYASS